MISHRFPTYISENNVLGRGANTSVCVRSVLFTSSQNTLTRFELRFNEFQLRIQNVRARLNIFWNTNYVRFSTQLTDMVQLLAIVAFWIFSALTNNLGRLTTLTDLTIFESKVRVGAHPHLTDIARAVSSWAVLLDTESITLCGLTSTFERLDHMSLKTLNQWILCGDFLCYFAVLQTCELCCFEVF